MQPILFRYLGLALLASAVLLLGRVPLNASAAASSSSTVLTPTHASSGNGVANFQSGSNGTDIG